MIPFTPLLKPPAQVAIAEPAQSRNVSNTFRIRAMTRGTGNDVCVRNSLQVNGPPNLGQVGASVSGGLERQSCEVVRQVAGKQRVEVARRTPHVLPGLRVVPDVLTEIHKLPQDILAPLSGQSGRDADSLPDHAVTPPAVAYCCWHIARPSGSDQAYKCQDRQL